MPQFVYILTNPSMPGLIKIGRTDDSLKARIKALNSHPGVPIPFEVHYACEVTDSINAEKTLHNIFEKERYNPKREFFTRNPESVVLALSSSKYFIREARVNEKDIVEFKEELKALHKENNKKRDSFNFAMVDIPIGSELSFIRDSSIKAIVIDDKKISIDGEITSLSAAAQKLIGSNYPVQGTIFWIYQDETLDERRNRLAGN